MIGCGGFAFKAGSGKCLRRSLFLVNRSCQSFLVTDVPIMPITVSSPPNADGVMLLENRRDPCRLPTIGALARTPASRCIRVSDLSMAAAGFRQMYTQTAENAFRRNQASLAQHMREWWSRCQMHKSRVVSELSCSCRCCC